MPSFASTRIAGSSDLRSVLWSATCLVATIDVMPVRRQDFREPARIEPGTRQ
ncbi:hypothetical protein SAMN07250955_11172 [Arboricoccus pini]|uniref:Uncharacterized protein n=1 Tax=Arboricoccus pini TaxID=1963835 RepID=A0A212RND4_9PROT|nr:hypothetical protein SAMN07250955_11172 [Arboricoccus pini]